MDNLGDCGSGPFTVHKNEDDGFYYVVDTRQDPPSIVTRADGSASYPLAKTANRRARELNASEPRTEPEIIATIPAPPFEPEDFPEEAEIAPAVEAAAEIIHHTREQWLNAFVEASRPKFAEIGFPLPEKVRVSVGFPFGARGIKAIGQCWHVEASADGINEIFVSPVVTEGASRLADILTHELCHAATPGEKHNPKTFGKCARALGLDGKLTATIAGEGWRAWADPIVEALGPIPFAPIDPKASGRKTEKTYLLKGVCKECGFTVRLTKKWCDAAIGELRCPDSECEGRLEVSV